MRTNIEIDNELMRQALAASRGEIDEIAIASCEGKPQGIE
jgi:Arc/MetJ family transcription regulator